VARLKKYYNDEIIPAMVKKFGFTNKLAVPKLEKIVVNMGVGKAIEYKKRLESAFRDMTLIAGQKPVITKARRSIAGFHLREGQAIGCKVTLRHKIMYEFLDRLINIAIPRIRDFRGLGFKSFDKRGHYSLGITDYTIFPEINLETVEFPQGMDIVFVIKNGSHETSLELLKLFGMPFKSKDKISQDEENN
jgi:large subunit ribosomal protein L5